MVITHFLPRQTNESPYIVNPNRHLHLEIKIKQTFLNYSFICIEVQPKNTEVFW